VGGLSPPQGGGGWGGGRGGGVGGGGGGVVFSPPPPRRGSAPAPLLSVPHLPEKGCITPAQGQHKLPKRMEFLTILLSALLGLVSPAGFVLARVAETAIREQLDSAEALSVRIDNTPSYRALQGRVDRVRIAGRGLYPLEEVRVAVLDVETDAIALDPQLLRQGQPKLVQPLQAAIKVVVTEADINQALQSETILEPLRNLNLSFSGSAAESELIDPQIEVLPGDRLRLQVTLQDRQTREQTRVVAESGLQISAGRQLQLVDPSIRVDQQLVAPELLAYLIGNASQRFDLATWEPSGITARILNLELEGNAITLVGFVRVEPEADLDALVP
jgi:hypothetical protein